MPWTPKYPVRLTQVPKLMALTPFVSICHAEFSMFGRVKFGTINASQLFFQGSHVFSFSNSGYMPAKIKSLHSTAGSENIWQLCCQNLFHKGDHSFKFCFKLKIILKTMKTLRPRDSFCFLLVSNHFFYPNFKRPIPSQKWILKQQVRIPLSIPKHRTKITCQCTNPFCHLVRATPKTTRKPFQGHGRLYRPRPPWPPQRSAARPRRRGRSELPDAAPSSLARRGCDADGGAAAAAVEKQSVALGCFSGLLGKYFVKGHR